MGVSALLVLPFQESGFCAQCYHGALELSWHTLGVLGQELVFLCFSSAQGTDAVPEAGQGFGGAARRGSASPEPAHGSVSTDSPCSASSQGEEMDSAAYPGHLFKSRFFWHP